MWKLFHVNTHYSCQILIKFKRSRQIFENNSNIKFHQNPSCGSWVVPCERADGRANMTKLIVAFRSFVNSPKNYPWWNFKIANYSFLCTNVHVKTTYVVFPKLATAFLLCLNFHSVCRFASIIFSTNCIFITPAPLYKGWSKISASYSILFWWWWKLNFAFVTHGRENFYSLSSWLPSLEKWRRRITLHVEGVGENKACNISTFEELCFRTL